MKEIKVGFCVAYDWELLRHSLPLVYDDADVIYVSIDKARRSWSGSTYEWNHKLFESFIQSVDSRNKIRIYEDDFFKESLTAGENEVRQRQMLAKKMDNDGWHIQLDCDEYFLGFKEFVEYLKSLPKRNKPFNVCCSLVTLFKKVEEGFFYVWPGPTENLEFIQIASQSPQYQYGRRNGHFNIYTNYLIMHQSWARSENEIQEKISNWGHRADFDVKSFFEKWKQLDKKNYHEMVNFHPIKPTAWSSLRFLDAPNIEKVLATFKRDSYPKLSNWALRSKNSRFMSYNRSLWKLIVR